MKTYSCQIKVFLALAIGLFIVQIGQGQTLQANNDTIDIIPGIPVIINVLANDIYPPGDSIKISPSIPYQDGIRLTSLSGGIMTFMANWGFGDTVSGGYKLIDLTLGDTSIAELLFRNRDQSVDSLYLNNINARFCARGIHFFGDLTPKFEVPKFSGKTTIFSNSVWIGGLDHDSVLYLAAQRYGQGPSSISSAWTHFDFWAGPVMDSSVYSIYTDTVWNYIWNLKKSEIEYHKLHWWESGYSPIHDIKTWPGNGNTALGQASLLAPFFDRDNNGIYNPYDGDYPLIRGDQSLFFMFNDDEDIHAESQGNPMKIEIHGMAYVFDIPQDTAFYHTLFLNYKIFNRSNRTYYNTYVGLFTDLDLGWSQDDFIGCDVERSSYFAYNGKPVDGYGQPEAYGEHPPSQSVTFLGGPFLDPDGIDNPRYDRNGHQLCNESVNGVNFGDSVIDNERYGMSKFVYFNNNLSGVPQYMQDPYYAPDFYQMLQGIWHDSTRMIYGGNAHLQAGGYGPECNFMFPGESDTLNWGIGCQLPNGPVNWTEETAQNNPSDRRGVGSMGPFTFFPNSCQEVDVAFIFAQDSSSANPQSSLGKLRRSIDVIRNSFVSNTLPNGSSFNGIKANNNGESPWSIQMYPNPASTLVKFLFAKSEHNPITISVITSSGILVKTVKIKPATELVQIDISGLPQGLYLVNFQSQSEQVTKKLSVIR